MAKRKTKPDNLDDVIRLIPGYDPVSTAGDAWFDADGASDALDFFPECLCHVEGYLAGEPFALESWQQAIIANLFGWKRTDSLGRTVRRYRESLIFVPRKNGKTPLAAGIGLYCLFSSGLEGQQNYIAASTREQAGLLFRHCRGMVEREPEMSSRCRIYGGNAPGGQSQSIVREHQASFLKVIAGDVGVGKHGKNLDLAIVDELHELPDRDLVDTLRSSMVSLNKPEPLLIYTTTSDYDRPSICNEVYDRAVKIRDGLIEASEFLPVIYEASRDDDWTSPATWAAANPNLGVSVSEDFLRSECQKAKDDPAYENTFKQLHLNIRTEQSVRLIQMDRWDACGVAFDATQLRGRTCYAGLDLATVDDLAALVLVFPPSEADGVYHCLPWFWCPQSTAEKAERGGKAPYLTWARANYLEVTPGNSIDYAFIRRRVNEIARCYALEEIAYDPWNATHLSQQLREEDGYNAVEMRQGFVTLNEPTKFLLRLLADGKLRHNGHPVLRWMASNVAARNDPAGNLKPDKAKSSGKIDGIVALVMALGRAAVTPVSDPGLILI